MRWGKKERVTFASECTSMLMTKSCCIDCQGAVLRPEDLRRTLRFFVVFLWSDCSQQVTAKCSTRVLSILMFLAK